MPDHPVLSDVFVPGSQNQIWVAIFQLPVCELVEFLVQALVIRLIVDVENSCPHSSSVIAYTCRVDTPCTYISDSALTNAFSLRVTNHLKT